MSRSKNHSAAALVVVAALGVVALGPAEQAEAAGPRQDRVGSSTRTQDAASPGMEAIARSTVHICIPT